MDDVTVCPAVNKPTDRIKINKKRPKKKQKQSDKLLTEWNCNLCPQQISCKELCPPMEWIVSQVEVEPANENPASDMIMDEKTPLWPETMCTSEIIFSLFFFEHLKPPQIAKQLRISTRYVYKSVEKSKEILLLNLRKKVQFGSLYKKD